MFDQIHGDVYEKKTLLVVPYAGGSSQSFSSWKRDLEKDVHLRVLDYPGHGRRMRENLLYDFYMLVEDLVEQLRENVGKSTIVFGHSMGGLVCAYATAEAYRKYGIIFDSIIISSCMAPEYFVRRKRINWNDNNLVEYLKTERNISSEIISTKEFKKYLLPAIKNDFRILQDFHFKRLLLPPCPVHCIYAKQDYEINKDVMKDWQKHSMTKICWHDICGSHFYFEEYPEKTYTLIRSIVREKYNYEK